MKKIIISILICINIGAFGQVKISDMPSATNLTGAFLPIVQGGVNKKAASTLFSISANSPLSLSSGTMSIPKADTATDGYLGLSDWSLFKTSYNRSGTSLSFSSSTFTFTKQDGGALTVAVPTFNQNTTGSAAKWTTGRTISISGDITYTSPSIDGTGNVTAAGTLATVNSNVGTFGSATKSVTATVNGKGLITAISEQTLTPAVGSITGLGTGIATWLGTPSWTNFTSSITGTAPYWDLASGGTATASNTFTSNTNSWLNFLGTWTATANTQYHAKFGGSFTARATSSDRLIGYEFIPTLTNGGASQTLDAVLINPVVTGGTNNNILRVQNNGTDMFTVVDLGTVVGGSAPISNVSLSVLANGNTTALQVKGNSTGTSKTVKFTNSGNTETFSITDRGNAIFTENATSASANLFTLTQAAHTAGSGLGAIWNFAAHTSQGSSTEVYDFNFNNTRTVGYTSSTSLTKMRSFIIGQPTYSAGLTSSVTDISNVYITGAPSISGTNLAPNTSNAIYVDAGAVSSQVTASYGINVNAQTGGINNYAALLNGRTVLGTKPTRNDTIDQVLARDFTTGEIKYIKASTLVNSGISSSDIGYSLTGGNMNILGVAANNTQIGAGGTSYLSISTNGLFNASSAAVNAATPLFFNFAPGAHTNITASTESPDFVFDMDRSVQWATGNFATQRFLRVKAPTMTAVGASTVTDASTVEISGAPAAGSNMTLTRSWAMTVTGGNSNFGGNVYVGATGVSPTSTLHVGGSFATNYTSKSVNYSVAATDNVIEVTATGKTITLPTAASITGRIYTIKLTASGSGTVATTSSQTIDGGTTYSLSAQYKYVTVQSNGSNWIIIANN